MTEFKGCKNYTLLSVEKLDDINANAFILCHDKTKARIVLIQNDDENKTFVIGFKTPQDNSTGVPHILEHSVLCGSKKYPVKDAMTEVSKGSLNTFLNAFTYPDRTLYPVASCNDKDFQNLMGVYLDAVFFPRVYDEKKIFMQEGWHYELESLEDDLKYNGVVYNEMKGVYSAPESALSSYVLFSLFPDTQYGVESGGDPDHIPELTYEEFVSFHKKLYHPSNSRIFLYGDMDFEEKLKYIDEEYLSLFDAIIPDSEVVLQKPFTEPKNITKEYAISDSEDENSSSFLTYNVVSSDYTDVLTTEVMDVINYALCTVPGAKLKERLIDEGIGKDVYSDYVTDTCQKVFSIVAQDASPDDEKRFVKIIEDTIEEIIKEGFDKKTLEAAITSHEFTYREGDFGYYPKGIAYAMMTFDDWNYSDEDVFTNLKQNEIYEKLRNGINEGLFEKVLKERVLDNPHKTILTMNPKKGLAKEKEEALADKLKEIKNSFTEEELINIVEETKELKKYQEEEDSEEALATIPTLSIDDIKKDINKIDYEIVDYKGIKEIYSRLNTNGIAYFSLCFNVDHIPNRLIPALSIVKALLGLVNTEHYSYGELVNEVNIATGGISTTAVVYKLADSFDEFTTNFEVKTKVLYSKIDDAFNLIKEILFTSDLSDKKRVHELLEQSKLRLQGYMISSGHAVAIQRGTSYLTETGVMQEKLSGLDQFRLIEDLTENFDERFDELYKDMNEVLSLVLNKNNLEVSLGCEESFKDTFDEKVYNFVKAFKSTPVSGHREGFKPSILNEGLSSSSQVQYVAMIGNYKKDGLPYTGSLQVLRNILSNDYLWTSIRLQGGAYGCMCAFPRSGDSFFVSYRDPNLKKTLESYKKAEEYIANFPEDKEGVERFVITTIGDLDVPLSPSIKLSRGYGMYKSKVTNEMAQLERNEILATTPEIIRGLSRYIASVCKQNAVCTVGGEEMFEKEGDVFTEIVPLYKN